MPNIFNAQNLNPSVSWDLVKLARDRKHDRNSSKRWRALQGKSPYFMQILVKVKYTIIWPDGISSHWLVWKSQNPAVESQIPLLQGPMILRENTNWLHESSGSYIAYTVNHLWTPPQKNKNKKWGLEEICSDCSTSHGSGDKSYDFSWFSPFSERASSQGAVPWAFFRGWKLGWGGKGNKTQTALKT